MIAHGAENREASSGALVLIGRLDLTAGARELHRSGWLVHDGHSQALGLSGHSDDGGRTFKGSATSGFDSLTFTVRHSRSG